MLRRLSILFGLAALLISGSQVGVFHSSPMVTILGNTEITYSPIEGGLHTCLLRYPRAEC